MSFLIDKNVVGFFGDATDNLNVDGNDAHEKFIALRDKLHDRTGYAPDFLFFLKQTHSADVMVIDRNPEKPFIFREKTGDAIITDLKNIGIGVITADCLPVFLIDHKNHAIAVIHAGWQGLSINIISAVIQKMQTVYQTNAADLKVYVGPAAGICCYEVQLDFLAHFPSTVFENKIVERRDGKLFFNSLRAASHELLGQGILIENIDTSHHTCTICSEQFCSFRRQKEKAGRQPSVLFLLQHYDNAKVESGSIF